MIRPEAKAQLIKWREVLIGGIIATTGVWWLVGPGRLLVLPAIGFLIAGSALIWIGIQRARFRSGGLGPGTVQVDEGQITYFGPLTGGAVALTELARLTLDKSLFPAHWRLEQPGQPALLIPINAQGADALFDAFTALSGLRTEKMLSAMQAPDKHPIVIWQREGRENAHLSLH